MLVASRPRPLQPGDRVAVIAPSGPIPSDRLQQGMAELRAWGLQPSLGRHVEVGGAGSYLSAGDAQRALDFETAWRDPAVRAVLCARGGYGAHRMLDHVDWSGLREARAEGEAPTLVGYSDVTALHEAVATELGTATLHGPMVAAGPFSTDEESREGLRRALFGAPTSLPTAGARVLVPGRATGPLAGGNASVIAAGLATPHARRSWAGAIVLLEDVDEEDYRLDRILTQLRRSGLLDQVAGVLGGTWVGCPDDAFVDARLLDLFGDLGVPVVNGLPLGHGAPLHSLWLGAELTLEAGDRGVVVG